MSSNASFIGQARNIVLVTTDFSVVVIWWFCLREHAKMSGRRRSPNFTSAKTEILLDLLSGERGDIVESKRTDISSVENKEKVWKKITEEFKDRSGNSMEEKNLKFLWNDPVMLSPISERVANILPKQQITPFDSDALSTYLFKEGKLIKTFDSSCHLLFFSEKTETLVSSACFGVAQE